MIRTASQQIDTAPLASPGPLVVIETHPVQYRAPVYRAVQSRFGVPVTAIYGSDFSVAGSLDVEFNTSFAWDTDLLSGYTPVFLSRVAQGGGANMHSVSADGLDAALRRCAPAAVLLTGYSPRFHQAAFYHARKTRSPILFRGETTDHAARRSTIKQWTRDSALRYLYRCCSSLLYVGARSRQHLLRLGCEDKLIFSPYCVDTSPFQLSEEQRTRLRAETRSQLGIAPDQIVLLFSGKLSPRKGPDRLIAAVKSLPAALRSRIALLFLGSGEMQETLARETAEAPSIPSHFLGFRNQRQLSPAYHAADLLVLPSRTLETWGLVVNEALHHGLPCLVSDAVGCLPDLVISGETGESFAAGSVESLRSGIERSLALIGTQEIRNRCRQQVQQYSIENAARGIAQAYQAAVQRARGSR